MAKVFYHLDQIQSNPLPTNHRFQNLTGQVFSHLTVLSFRAIINRRTCWWCKCECGNIISSNGGDLQSMHTTSCGCLHRKIMTKHGYTDSSTYKTYCSAKQRCNNPNNPRFKHYGGRGIEFRFASTVDFLATIGQRPTPDHSLDRIDNNGHYEASNVRWVTETEQQRNRQNNHILTIDGESKTLAEWTEIKHFKTSVLSSRIRLGWCNSCLFEATRCIECSKSVSKQPQITVAKFDKEFAELNKEKEKC